jgi:hypothetical protein
MKATIKLSLVAIFAVSLLASMGGVAQAAKHHRHLLACPGQPGTIAALVCPAKK